MEERSSRACARAAAECALFAPARGCRDAETVAIRVCAGRAFGGRGQKSSRSGDRIKPLSNYPTIQQGYRVLYRETHKLLDDLAKAAGQGARAATLKAKRKRPIMFP